MFNYSRQNNGVSLSVFLSLTGKEELRDGKREELSQQVPKATTCISGGLSSSEPQCETCALKVFITAGRTLGPLGALACSRD